MALYHRLVPKFESVGVPLLGLRSSDEVPPSVDVLLGGTRGDPRTVYLRDNDEATLLAVVQRLAGRETFRTVVFGVDPGKTIGLAVLGDGSPLLVSECLDARSTIERLAAWMTGLDATSWHAHVGDGAPDVGQIILAGLAMVLPEVVGHVVPEERTTPRAPVTGSRHADAAVRIAMRRPSGTFFPDAADEVS